MGKNKLKKWKHRLESAEKVLLDLLYPLRCPICDNVAETGVPICLECRKKVGKIKEPVCKKCGKPLENQRVEYCFDCERKVHSFIQGKALWIYEKEVKASLYRFKYQNKREYAVAYAEETAKQYENWIRKRQIEVIVPIPLHRNRQKQRGYNQAEVFAEELGKILAIPVRTDLLIRVRDTKPQKELNHLERKNNLKKAFKISENIVQLNHILIVDDIYTTGSTIDAAASVLREAGASEVYFCCISIGRGC